MPFDAFGDQCRGHRIEVRAWQLETCGACCWWAPSQRFVYAGGCEEVPGVSVEFAAERARHGPAKAVDEARFDAFIWVAGEDVSRPDIGPGEQRI
jgi:hypothetical protein